MDRKSGPWWVTIYQPLYILLIPLGITPFVKPDDLKFYFEEIHRLTKS